MTKIFTRIIFFKLISTFFLVGFSSCEKEECPDPETMNLPVSNKLQDYENRIFDIYQGNDTIKLKESTTGIIYTYVSKPVNTYYHYVNVDDELMGCPMWEKYENKRVIFYRTDNQSNLSINIETNVTYPRSDYNSFSIYFPDGKTIYYELGNRFKSDTLFTYEHYTIEGVTYDSVYKIVRENNRDSSFNNYYALYSKTHGILQLKFYNSNTFFSRVK
jgi:hypothetical protein